MSNRRNQLCPCGSGHKTKKCCLLKCCETCLFSKEHLDSVNRGTSWSLSKSLVRQNSLHHLPFCNCLRAFSPKTIVLCGNGAVYWNDPNEAGTQKNVWMLVQKFVDELKASPEGKGDGIPSTASNFLFWLSGAERATDVLTVAKPTHYEKYDPIRAFQLDCRTRLAETIRKADIRLRPITCFGCDEKHETQADSLEDTGFITLNWDASITSLPHTIELHGSCHSPESIILPNQDMYNHVPRKGQAFQGFEVLTVSKDWFAKVENIVIWGCNMNDYDAMIPMIIALFTPAHKAQVKLFVSLPDIGKRQEVELKIKDYLPRIGVVNCINSLK